MEHIFSPNSSEEQKKKRLHQKWNTFFPPNSSEDLRSDANQSRTTGGYADVDHTQTIWGIQSNYWGDISPIPPGFGTPATDRTLNDQFTLKIIFSNCSF